MKLVVKKNITCNENGGCGKGISDIVTSVWFQTDEFKLFIIIFLAKDATGFVIMRLC